MDTNLPYTPRVKRALALAQKLSASGGLNYVGAEHLLLGIFEMKEGPAHDLMTMAGLNPDDLGARLLAKYKEAPPAPRVVSQPTVGYEKTVTETEWGTKHQWRREDPNGNKCMVTIINPTPAQLHVIEKFTKAG